MSRSLVLNNCGVRSFGYSSRSKTKERVSSSKILSMSGKKEAKMKIKQKSSSGIFLPVFTAALVTMIFTCGAVYLYQVNDLATKGYEIRDIENRIQVLEKESKKMKIKEVELRSMYNIEKSTQELNLISPKSVTYVEMDSSVAMK
jgi:hypothetical protein